jgi:ATP-dependent DNA ligase
MKIDKRNFTDFDDKKAFPGHIDDCTKEYHFPSLYSKDSKDNVREWKIKIRIVKGNPKKYDIDWDVLLDNTVPVKENYLSGTGIPDGSSVQVWVETGVITGKSTRHPPSYPKIKNEGKSNERNILEQGLVEARTLYLKKVDNGFSLKKSFKNIIKKHMKYFPMLVRKYQDEKKHLCYPLYIQPKLDGARCIAYLDISPDDNPTIENVIMYTRQKKDYIGFDEIKKELLTPLIDMYDYKNNESVYIDGELYKHGLDLQTISGAVRNPKRSEIKKYQGIQFWVFDIFYPSDLSLPFKERMEYLDDLFELIDNKKSTNIIQVNTDKIENETELDKLYKQYLSKKYEGIILRNSDSLYLTHPTKNNMSIRSKYVLKRKMTYSDEFEVVDFTQGVKGRDKGAIMWILKTHNTDKIFHATPKNTNYSERYKVFKDATNNFSKKYKGRLMTIEYEDLSKDKVPLRAKSVGFREHT